MRSVFFYATETLPYSPESEIKPKPGPLQACGLTGILHPSVCHQDVPWLKVRDVRPFTERHVWLLQEDLPAELQSLWTFTRTEGAARLMRSHHTAQQIQLTLTPVEPPPAGSLKPNWEIMPIMQHKPPEPFSLSFYRLFLVPKVFQKQWK